MPWRSWVIEEHRRHREPGSDARPLVLNRSPPSSGKEGAKLLGLTHNRHRNATIVLLLMMILSAAPALAAAPGEQPMIALNLNPAILWTFLGITVLLALKQSFAVGAAVKDETFDWHQLPAVLQTNVLPYLVPLAAMAVASLVIPLAAIAYGVYATQYTAKLISDIQDNARRYFGINVPPQAE